MCRRVEVCKVCSDKCVNGISSPGGVLSLGEISDESLTYVITLTGSGKDHNFVLINVHNIC